MGTLIKVSSFKDFVMDNIIIDVNGILLGYDELSDIVYCSDPFSLFD